MIPDEVLDKIAEAAEAYLNETVVNNPIDEIINGDFPVAVKHDDKYFKCLCIMTSLSGEYIYTILDVEEISMNDFIDFQIDIATSGNPPSKN